MVKWKSPTQNLPGALLFGSMMATKSQQARFRHAMQGTMKQTELWEVRDSVVAINENNDILETELLFWDELKDIIYTDKFVALHRKIR